MIGMDDQDGDGHDGWRILKLTNLVESYNRSSSSSSSSSDSNWEEDGIRG